MIPPITIDGQLIMPQDIKYDATGVHIGSMYRPSDNPRSEFARILSLFTDPSTMRSNGSFWFRDNTIIGEGVSIGPFCVIGGDGFGYQGSVKIPHLGNVVIGANVEIHNGTSIDRAVIGSTVIGDRCKIDNNIHIAHGCKIGNDVLIVAGSVIGGSVVIGNGTFIGMNASIKNKVRIGAGCIIGAGAVVLKDVPDGETWVGNPGKKLVK